MSATTRISATFAAALVAALLAPQPVPAAESSPGYGVAPTSPHPVRSGVAGTGVAIPGVHGAADHLSKALLRRARVGAPRATSLAGGRALMERSGGGLHPCAFDDSLLCGQVSVPLDRAHPRIGSINVRFVVAPHTGSAAAPKNVVFATSGGPGNSITGSNGEMYVFRDYVLAPLTPTHDLVFVDQRGVGRSGAINCPDWQHRAMTYASAAQCARSLGGPHRRSLYSSAAAADDLDAVRQALGYDHIVVMGGSYAGNDMVTYAVRHRDHVSAVVVGSPILSVGADAFATTTPIAIPGVIDRLCSRTVACGNAYPHPRSLLTWLVHRVRHRPVTGVGYDFDGKPHAMRVTESLLLWAVFQDTDFPFYPGEVTQAAAALRAGDKVPLLRLAATHDPATGSHDQGPVRDYSNGDNLARFCADTDFPWDESAPAAVRHRQYADALAAQPARYGIFAKLAWAVPLPLGFFPDPCISVRWEHQPGYPVGSTVDDIPTLVLAGDLDLVVPTADNRKVTDVLTDSTFIEVRGAAHNPWFWRQCATAMVQRFIRTGQTDDACASEPTPRYWQVGSFPRSFRDAPQARSRPGDRSTAADRRLATVGVWSLLDSIHQLWGSTTQTGRGLRGGEIQAMFSPGPPTPDRFRLRGARFTSDAAVTGTGFFDFDNVVGGDIVVRGRGIGHAHLHFKGKWYTPDARWITVQGVVDGRSINVVVPAT